MNIDKMVGAGEVKVATVEIEDNTATLPIGHKGPSQPEHVSTPLDKQTLAIRDMEMRGVQPKPAKR